MRREDVSMWSQRMKEIISILTTAVLLFGGVATQGASKTMLDIPDAWQPSHSQNGTNISAIVRVLGGAQQPYPDPKTGKQVFQCKARILKTDRKNGNPVPSPVWAYLLSSAPLKKDSILRVSGQLSVSKHQIKGGAYPATIRVTTSRLLNGRKLLAGDKKKDTRPNIIFIMADDHAPHGLSCYGSKILKTPQIDRLAREGMRFSQAVGVNSLCAPARACLLTGKHSHLNGMHSNGSRFNGAQQTFPKLLQTAGYQTAIVGKWHLAVEPTGFDYYKVMRGHGSYFNPEFRETGKGWHREKGYLTDLTTDGALDWLRAREKDKPFCLMVHHKAPHGPDLHKEEHAKLFENETIPAPATLHDDWETREVLRTLDCPSSKLINCCWGQDIYKRLMATAPKEKRPRTGAVYQQMIKGYMRLVASLDENVGRLLDYIDESGLRRNTIVVYTSDNGFFLGEHGLYNKMWMYEESMRLPLLIRYPEVVKPGTVNDELVSILDFAPTFLNAAGAEIPEELQGQSILPLLRDQRPDDWRDAVYYHFYGAWGLEPKTEHYGVRTKTHKLLHFPKHGDGNYWELFDLTVDGNELTNVYGKPEYSDTQTRLHTRLKALQKKMKVPIHAGVKR